jgi:hypothetical protein
MDMLQPCADGVGSHQMRIILELFSIKSLSDQSSLYRQSQCLGLDFSLAPEVVLTLIAAPVTHGYALAVANNKHHVIRRLSLHLSRTYKPYERLNHLYLSTKSFTICLITN